MLRYVNPQALAGNVEERRKCIFSAVRETSFGRRARPAGACAAAEAGLLVDCDADALLLLVEPVGPGVCHEGYRSCFFGELRADGSARIIAEEKVVFDRASLWKAGGEMSLLKLGIPKGSFAGRDDSTCCRARGGRLR